MSKVKEKINKKTKEKVKNKPKNETSKKPDNSLKVLIDLKATLNEQKQNLDLMTTINLKCVEYSNCKENTNFKDIPEDYIQSIKKYVETKSGCDDKPFKQEFITSLENIIKDFENQISVLEEKIKRGQNVYS